MNNNNNEILKNNIDCIVGDKDCWKDGILPKEEMLLVPIHWVKNFSELYEFKSNVGSGRYGVVVDAISKLTGNRCACKIVLRKDEYLRELDHLICLSTIPGVLPIQRVSFSDKKMCMESELGIYTLHTAIRKTKYKSIFGMFNIIEEWFIEILKTIDLIHKQYILHRDLKPENIIMIYKDNKLIPKIIDFGLSKRIMGTCLMNDSILYDVVTSCYRAPELWNIKQENELIRHYSVKEESWSLGCIFIEMFICTELFQYPSISILKKNISSYIKYVLGYDPYNIYSSSSKILNKKRKLNNHNSFKYDIAKKLENAILNLFGHMVDLSTPELGTGTIAANFIQSDDRISFFKKFSTYEEIIRGFLHPIPERRLTPEDALRRLIPDYNILLSPKCQFFYDYPLYRIIPRNEIVINYKDTVIKTIELLFKIIHNHNIDPKSFFLGLYLWLSIIFDENTSWISHFHFRMLIVCCYELLNDYHYSNTPVHVDTILKNIPDFSNFYKYTNANFCRNFILTLKQGRTWIYNPGELRHLFFNKDNIIPSWNSHIDNEICIIILFLLNENFILPSPDTIISIVYKKIYLL